MKMSKEDVLRCDTCALVKIKDSVCLIIETKKVFDYTKDNINIELDGEHDININEDYIYWTHIEFKDGLHKYIYCINGEALDVDSWEEYVYNVKHFIPSSAFPVVYDDSNNNYFNGEYMHEDGKPIPYLYLDFNFKPNIGRKQVSYETSL